MSPSPGTLDTAKELLARLVAFDTTSSKSNLELIDFVEAYLKDHGIASTRIPSADGKKAALFWVCLSGSSKTHLWDLSFKGSSTRTRQLSATDWWRGPAVSRPSGCRRCVNCARTSLHPHDRTATSRR